jgi:UDP-N-acetylmuramoyl-L-alanyl-D-glutamate--2,6-diaminopimelate ligase
MDMMKGIAGLASDSREVKAGYLFAALPGTRADGASFIADAVRRGAIAVLGVPQARATPRRSACVSSPTKIRARAWRAWRRHSFGAQPKSWPPSPAPTARPPSRVSAPDLGALGIKAASMGTIGVVTPEGEIALAHTTPDPIETHRLLARSRRRASIIWRSKPRATASINIASTASTWRLRPSPTSRAIISTIMPISTDYLAAKLRLFTEVVREGGVAVVNADAPHAEGFHRRRARTRSTLVTVGEKARR